MRHNEIEHLSDNNTLQERLIKRIYAALERRAPSWLLENTGAYWTAYAMFWRIARRNASRGILGAHWLHESEFLSVLEQHSRPSCRALEIGCGGGRISARVAQLVSTLHATDVSRGMLALAKQQLQQHGNVRIQRTDGFTLKDFPDVSFELVYSHDVFVHFSSMQVLPYLKEISRVLTPGGKAVISFYDFGEQFETFKRLSLLYANARRTPPHMRIHFITEEQLRAMAADAGLRLLDSRHGHFLVVALEKITA
jgi:ubiquinone/menaquinone biosynthesis C-methylase UbiE